LVQLVQSDESGIDNNYSHRIDVSDVSCLQLSLKDIQIYLNTISSW